MNSKNKIVVMDNSRRVETFGSPQVGAAAESLKEAIRRGLNVLIIGETGTGKSTLVRKIAATFKERKFVEMNISSINPTLFESELFGHVRGAFTGASSNRVGYFEEADNGILFLDEIGDLSFELQAKILGATDGYFTRVGENQRRKFKGVCIFASNQDLETMVAQGKFRADLYFRVSEYVIRIPPLRERLSSFSRIVNRFLLDLNHRFGGEKKKTVSQEAMSCLLAYDWPGNMRELRTVLIRAILSAESEVIEASDLDLPAVTRLLNIDDTKTEKEERSEFSNDIETQERALIISALEKNLWVQKNAAKDLGISPRCLNYKIGKYGIRHPNWRRNKE